MATRVRHSQPGGTVCPASYAERHVHTVRLAEDSGYALPCRVAVSRNRMTDGFACTGTAVPNPIRYPCFGITPPPAIFFPFSSIWYCPENVTCGIGAYPEPTSPKVLSLNGVTKTPIWLPDRDADTGDASGVRVPSRSTSGAVCSGKPPQFSVTRSPGVKLFPGSVWPPLPKMEASCWKY